MDKISFNEPAFEITKSYRDTDGQMFVEGIASTTSIDATGERMSTEAIAKMAARLVGKPLRSEHGKGWDDKLGEIVKADIIQDKSNRPALWIKARLFDWSSKARDLFSLLTDGVTKMGLSVAGVIKPGGIIKEFSDAIGKFVPTYHDVEPTEVSVTDHPANLDTWAVAVAKSLNLDTVEEYNKERYENVDSEDFLDPENRKYPINSTRLMPALRYFNHDGQRTAGDYGEDQWATMGRKLAARLNKETDGKYQYNASSEKVERVDETTQKSGEEVNNVDKSKLASKEVNKDVADFVKQFKPDSDVKERVVEKKATEKTEEVKKTQETKEVKKDSTETGTSEDASSETSAELSMDSTSTSSDGETMGKDHDEIKQLLSELGSSLSAIKDAMSSTTTDGEGGSDEETDASDLMSTLSMCMDKMNKFMGKYGKAVKHPADGTQTSTPVTTTNKPVPGSDAADSKRGTTPSSESVSKTKEEDDKVARLEKVIKALSDKVDAIPNSRKGVAIAVEKNLGNDETKKETGDGELEKKLKADPEISMAEFHKWRNFGILPEKYKDYGKKE